jgi:predicted nucleic acid-binding protein
LSFYLDASVVVPVFREEPRSECVGAFLSAARGPLFVSDFAVGEVSSAFARLVRMGEISAENAAARIELLDDWVATIAEPIETDAADIRLAGRIVRRFALGLRFPDAVHIASAQLRSLTLVAGDQLMISAARELGVPALMP